MPNLDLKGDQKPAQILNNWGTQKMISQLVLENCKKKTPSNMVNQQMNKKQ